MSLPAVPKRIRIRRGSDAEKRPDSKRETPVACLAPTVEGDKRFGLREAKLEHALDTMTTARDLLSAQLFESHQEIAQLQARLVSAQPAQQGNSAAPAEHDPCSGRGWRTVTHLTADGTAFGMSMRYNTCPDCWPSHRVIPPCTWRDTSPDNRDKCHWCGARRTT